MPEKESVPEERTVPGTTQKENARHHQKEKAEARKANTRKAKTKIRIAKAVLRDRGLSRMAGLRRRQASQISQSLVGST